MDHVTVYVAPSNQNPCHDSTSLLMSRGPLCPCGALRTVKWPTYPPTPHVPTYPAYIPIYLPLYAPCRSSPRRCRREWPGFRLSLRPRQRRWPSSRANWRWPSHRWAGKVGQLDQPSGHCCGLQQHGQQGAVCPSTFTTMLPMRCIPCACATKGFLHYPHFVHTMSTLFHTGPGRPGRGVPL